MDQVTENESASQRTVATDTPEQYFLDKRLRRHNDLPSCKAHQPTRKTSSIHDSALAALKVAEENFQQAVRLMMQVQSRKMKRDSKSPNNECEMQDAPMKTVKTAQTIFLRALRRVRQAEYRRKERSKLETLHEDIHQLQNDVKKLEHLRRDIFDAVPPKDDVWSVAVEYFRLFRYGLPQFSSDAAMEASVQLDFVRVFMTADVNLNGELGCEVVLRSWQNLSTWFEAIEVELEELKKGEAGSVVATTTTRVTITERTIGNAFPNLRRTGCRGGCLANQLLGQRIVMCGSTVFAWDSAFGQVTWIKSESNMLAPLLNLLGNLEDVALVLDKALISPNFQLTVIP